MHLQGALLESAREVTDQGEPARAVGVAVGRIVGHPGEVPFGVVHRDLGTSQQQRRGGAVLRGVRDADAGAHVEVDVAEVERVAEVAADPLHHAFDMYVVGAEQDGELVPAEPSDHRLLVLESPQSLTDLLEQLVADVVAEGVVDLLEAVEVHQQHGRRAGRQQPFLEPLLEVQAVGQPGEMVVQREVFGLGGGGSDAVEQSGVRERDARVARERFEQPRVLTVESADVVEAVHDQQHTRDAAAVAQRRGHRVGVAGATQRVVDRQAPVPLHAQHGAVTRVGPPGRRIVLRARAEHDLGMLGAQQVLCLAHDGLDHRLVADSLVDRSGELIEQVQPAVTQPLDVIAAVERDAEQPDDREQCQALRLAMQHQRGDQGEVGVDEGGDQPTDGAEAEAGPDPPTANRDDDGDGDVGQQRGREGGQQRCEPGEGVDFEGVRVEQAEHGLEDEDRHGGLQQELRQVESDLDDVAATPVRHQQERARADQSPDDQVVAEAKNRPSTRGTSLNEVEWVSLAHRQVHREPFGRGEEHSEQGPGQRRVDRGQRGSLPPGEGAEARQRGSDQPNEVVTVAQGKRHEESVPVLAIFTQRNGVDFSA